ncbi:TPA: dATP/dGTP pyrophosphohydrolase domain-containing protein [Salmonella enterica subsp. enterica serovar Muenster]|nr:Eaa protein [Salmonella enterica subsp. enterica]
MTTNTNNKLTDETLKAWKTEAIISLGETPKDCREYSHHEAILALVTELQERRKADNQEPASERERIRREHAEWSDATFGDVGPIGPLKHLSKEALEAAADPSEPLEWADMQFLLWDAQRRMGISDEFITRAMIEKLEINKSRQWPEPKDGEPRLHIKEQPAPVVPDEMATSDDMNLYQKSFAQGYNACRAAMLQGAEAVSNRDELQVIGWLRSDYNSDDKRDPNAPLFMLGSNDPSEAWGVKYIPLSGNSPVTQDGWISCSERMPDDEQEVIVHNKLGYRYVSYFDEHSGLFFDMRGGNQMNCIEHILVTHWMPLPAAPEPEQS